MMPAITGDAARPGRLWHAGIPRLSESRSRAVPKAGATGLNAAASSISTGFDPGAHLKIVYGAAKKTWA